MMKPPLMPPIEVETSMLSDRVFLLRKKATDFNHPQQYIDAFLAG